jgi:hypothetical protein
VEEAEGQAGGPEAVLGGFRRFAVDGGYGIRVRYTVPCEAARIP